MFKDKSKVIGGCGIFLGLYNPTLNNISYTLLVRKHLAIVYTGPDSTIEVDYPEDEDFLHFIVFCHNACRISALSPQGGIQILAKVYNSSLYRNI